MDKKILKLTAIDQEELFKQSNNIPDSFIKGKISIMLIWKWLIGD